jgi:hypothetical protein
VTPLHRDMTYHAVMHRFYEPPITL